MFVSVAAAMLLLTGPLPLAQRPASSTKPADPAASGPAVPIHHINLSCSAPVLRPATHGRQSDSARLVLFSRIEAFAMIRSYKGIWPTIPDSCYVDESAQVIGDVVLGENASIWMNAVVRGDVHSIRIGANSNIQDNSVMHGMLNQWPVIVGDWVTVGHSVTLHGCVVEDRCLIGMGVIILNGARIGAGSIIAAGTLIPEETVIPPGSLVMGVPGKVRKQLGEEQQQTILRYAKNYLGYKETYLTERKK
jgi:carbonic anhydrase/acetyltransferase-like protein (isoleucine patch superfamily)